MPNDPRNVTTKTTTSNLASLLNQFYAKKTDLPTKVSDLTNDSDFQTGTQVENAISAAVVGALRPAGSVAFASLPALTEANLNKIVNVTDAFTTTADFVEGAGVAYPAGTNVAIINVGTEQSPVYKYDVYTGIIDTSGFMNKVSGGADNNILLQDANGDAKASNKKLSDFVEKETGKGLSSNDYTNEEKTKLGGISTGANKTEQSQTNGNILIDGTETTVYTLPASVLQTSDISDYTDAELRTLLGLPAAE